MNDADDEDFARLIGPVRRLEHDRIEPAPRRPRTRLRQQGIQPAAASPMDDHELPLQVDREWFHHGLQKKLCRRIRQGELPIDARLDLHGLRRSEAWAAFGDFLRQSLMEDCRFLVIVHGQGYGSRNEAVLKPLIRHWLSRQDCVMAWCPAQPKHGGDGATYVYLRRQSPSP